MSYNCPKCRDTKRHIDLKEQEERLGRAMAKLAKQEREERKELRSMISFHERARSKENGSKGGRPKIGENSEQAKARRWGTAK
jgi:hypothetical protein